MKNPTFDVVVFDGRVAVGGFLHLGAIPFLRGHAPTWNIKTPINKPSKNNISMRVKLFIHSINIKSNHENMHNHASRCFSSFFFQRSHWQIKISHVPNANVDNEGKKNLKKKKQTNKDVTKNCGGASCHTNKKKINK